ncbi:MAG: hypothetical protein A2092_13725 [Rhodobacteraceae bacterium GWE1_64_9]|nr:MAG: hypothetical protein A2092_13725 [Rhodobacteraceae bacterium GWE1_64_9]
MEAGSRKTLYVHIGLHKTGSTSLQNFLQLNEATLLAGGLYIPRSGRHQRELTAPTIIHSHLSWQYLGRPLFDPAAGGLAEVQEEIETITTARRFLLTDEGLSRIKEPAAFLANVPNHRVVVIACIRNPFSAAPSLYSEYLRFGTTVPFATWLKGTGRAMLNHGVIVKRWRQHAELRLIRVDEMGPDRSRIFELFLQALDHPADAMKYPETAQNMRCSMGEAAAMYYANRILQKVDPEIHPDTRHRINQQIKEKLATHWPGPVQPYGLSSEEITALAAMFPTAAAKAPASEREPTPSLSDEQIAYVTKMVEEHMTQEYRRSPR